MGLVAVYLCAESALSLYGATVENTPQVWGRLVRRQSLVDVDIDQGEMHRSGSRQVQSISVALQLLSAAIGLVSAIVLQISLAHALGPQSFGIYGVAISTQHFAMVGQDGGFRAFLMREAARPSKNVDFTVESLMGRALAQNLLVTFLALLVAILVLGLALWQAILFAILGASAKVAVGFVSGILIGRKEFNREAIWQIMGRLMVAIAGGLAALLTGSATVVLGAMFVAQVVMLLPIVHRVAFSRPHLSLHREINFFTGKMTLLAFMTALYFRSGPMILYLLGRNLVEISHYSLLHRLLDALLFLIAPLTQFVFVHARISRGLLIDRRRIIPIATVWLVVGAVGCLLTFHFGGEVIAVVVGEAYRPAGQLGGWFALAFLFAGPNFLMMQVFLARGQENVVLASSAAAVTIGLVLNLALIPSFGAVGAAISIVGSESALCIALCFFGIRSHIDKFWK